LCKSMRNGISIIKLTSITEQPFNIDSVRVTCISACIYKNNAFVFTYGIVT
jgi:hypothetical protein